MAKLSERVDSSGQPLATAEPSGPPEVFNGTGTMGGRMGEQGLSLRNIRTFASLKEPTYRLFFASMLAQMASLNMQMIARSLLVYQLTGSGTALGIISMANALPMLVTSVFGGVIADRVPKKRVLTIGQWSSAIVTLAIAITLTMGLLSQDIPGSWLILVIAALGQGTIMGLIMPSRQAIISEIVSEDKLMNALALNNLGMNVLRIMAPALAGFLIADFGFEAVYYTMTGLYIVSGVFALLLPLTGTMSIQGRGAFQDMKEGFLYVRDNTIILQVLMVALVMVVFSMPYMLLLPMFTEGIWNAGPQGMGLLISVSGIGAVVGSLVLASLPNKKRGLLFLLSGLVSGVTLTVFAFSPTFAFALAIGVFIGVGQTGRMTLSNTLLQYYTAERYRGRVLSIYFMEFGVTNVGVFFAGIAADMVGVQWTVGGLAIALIALSIGGIVFMPRIRKLD